MDGRGGGSARGDQLLLSGSRCHAIITGGKLGAWTSSSKRVLASANAAAPEGGAQGNSEAGREASSGGQ